MKEFGLKICLFLFLAGVFSGRTSELGTLTSSITGTILLWPLYRRLAGLPLTPCQGRSESIPPGRSKREPL
jgi:hypothetical protein